MKRKASVNRLLVTFLAPSLLLYGLFVLAPALVAIKYSLLNWDGLSAPKFAGLSNFKSVLSSQSALPTALGHNISLTVVPGIIILALALFFAYVIHQKIPGARVFRVAFFFPNIISSVAVAVLWQQIYAATSSGLLNSLLTPILHLKEPIPFTQSDRLLPALIPVIVWTATGFYMVLFLAAMENIPEEIYEAARLDGASPVEMFFRVTLPLIWEVLITGISFLVIGGLKLFDVVWVMESGRPSPQTHTLSTLMYSKVFEEYNIGQGTAIALLLFLLVLLTTLVSRRALQRETVQG